MRRIAFLVQKEFIQIFRDPFMVRLIFLVPIIQLIVLAYAATFEVKDIKIHLIDREHTQISRQLISKIEASAYFQLVSTSDDKKTAYQKLEKDVVDVVMVIPTGLSRDLSREESASIQLLVNAINGTKASIAQAYLNMLIRDFSIQIKEEFAGRRVNMGIDIRHRFWYNPTKDYKWFMVPGILVMLVTLLSMFLTSINIVREKEVGTIEQLNVTTMRSYEFILGKLIPFAILALIVLTLGLLVGYYLFGIPYLGDMWLVYLYAICYIVATMGLGILISNISSSQQQAMFTAFFFIIIFVLMSGLFTPISAMPEWAQWLTYLNPLAYFIEFMRMVLLKGSEFMDVQRLFIGIIIYGLASNALALFTYRKRTV